jgi:isoquinoline 1-oxidoreductase beta subunit
MDFWRPKIPSEQAGAEGRSNAPGPAPQPPTRASAGTGRSSTCPISLPSRLSSTNSHTRPAGTPRRCILELLGPDRIIDMDSIGLVGKASDYGAYDAYPVDTSRLRGVLEVVADRAGWGQPLPPGEGRGLAVVRASSSYLASVVHVAVGRDGTMVIPRVDIAIDAGVIVHPDRVRAQMEGGTVMGLGNALIGEITFKGGRAEQSNYTGYRVLRIDAAPREIRVYLVPSHARSSGVGEPAVAPTLPAACNAIFAATGRRVRSLPVGGQLGVSGRQSVS